MLNTVVFFIENPPLLFVNHSITDYALIVNLNFISSLQFMDFYQNLMETMVDIWTSLRHNGEYDTGGEQHGNKGTAAPIFRAA